MLDTNALIECLRRNTSMIETVKKYGTTNDLFISTITLGELMVGISKNDTPRRRAALNKILSPISILDYNQSAANYFAVLKKTLENEGVTIGPYDLQIAGHALAEGHILVTHNTKEFERVPNLKIVDWQKFGT